MKFSLDEIRNTKVGSQPNNQAILASVGAVQNPKRQPSQRSEIQDQRLDPVQTCLGYRITILSLRRRLVDGHDNLRTGAKPLVDRITTLLGFSTDDHPNLSWEYGQIETRGEQGTVVKIETI